MKVAGYSVKARFYQSLYFRSVVNTYRCAFQIKTGADGYPPDLDVGEKVSATLQLFKCRK